MVISDSYIFFAAGWSPSYSSTGGIAEFFVANEVKKTDRFNRRKSKRRF